MRVLVVDDEEVIRDVLGTLLTREGYEVASAASAGEAIALFENEPYDVVLLDLMLPDRPGLDVLRDIRRRDPDAVVVIVTAYSSIEGAIEAMRQGAFHYIPKPFQNEEVLLTLRKGSEARRLTEENRRLREELSHATGSGASPASPRACARSSSWCAWRGPPARRSSWRARAARARSSWRGRSTRTRRARARPS
jgi:DNA-binding NtrC family response regulator